ncbi:hypothetical protein DV092_03675 [Clostridium botulinum]|uniref:DUF3880 domain-containing protein n=1 Tax=unclassified Clostridium TaxID=2614128 RepID=UPI0020792FB6|nr:MULTISPECIES: DUF3880 domain-containing protein [unclassified Clostridium]MBN1051157.1 hypothetical protein [Clostridium botulinum]
MIINVTKKLSNNGFRNVFYIPVAANVKRIDKIKINPIDSAKYSCDANFLGTTDINNDFNKYIGNLLSERLIQKYRKY